MMRGLQLLELAATGEQISRYHIEAGIAAEYCIAERYDNVRWENIIEAYELLEMEDTV